MKLSELSPFPTYVKWEGEPVKLKPFSLRAITWAERFFFKDGTDGFERMNSILRNEESQEVFFNTIIDITYYLGFEDFESLGIKSPVYLKKKVAESKDKLKILTMFKDGLEEILINSFPKGKREPEKKGGKIFEQLQKKKKAPKSEINETDWAQVYIEFYRSGGMTIDKFMDLTTRQIGPLLEEIRFKKFEELALITEATAKRTYYKTPQRKVVDEFTDEDIQAFEREHKKLSEQNRIH